MRILSWNIRWGCGADGRIDLARIAAAIHALGQAEVICLQEVAVNHVELAGSAGEDQVATLAAMLPGYTLHFAAGSDLPDERGSRRLFGNLLLSRVPVLQVQRQRLPWPADPDVPSMPRVALEATLLAPWGPLRVTTTHLEYYSPAQRAAQVEALRALHAEACAHAGRLRPDHDADAPFRALPRPASAVFCGDFNCSPATAEYQRMLAPFDAAPPLLDAWALAHGPAPHAPTVGVAGFDWPDSPYCCDFFFVSEDLAARVETVAVSSDPDGASDHRPLLLTLREQFI